MVLRKRGRAVEVVTDSEESRKESESDTGVSVTGYSFVCWVVGGSLGRKENGVFRDQWKTGNNCHYCGGTGISVSGTVAKE